MHICAYRLVFWLTECQSACRSPAEWWSGPCRGHNHCHSAAPDLPGLGCLLHSAVPAPPRPATCGLHSGGGSCAQRGELQPCDEFIQHPMGGMGSWGLLIVPCMWGLCWLYSPVSHTCGRFLFLFPACLRQAALTRLASVLVHWRCSTCALWCSRHSFTSTIMTGTTAEFHLFGEFKLSSSYLMS